MGPIVRGPCAGGPRGVCGARRLHGAVEEAVLGQKHRHLGHAPLGSSQQDSRRATCDSGAGTARDWVPGGAGLVAGVTCQLLQGRESLAGQRRWRYGYQYGEGGISRA